MSDQDRALPGTVEVSQISHSYGPTRVLDSVDLTVADGEFLTLLGPSGSGKTTLLRIIGGLVSPEAGSVTIGGRDVTNVPARDRGIGFVFQSYALFPHLNVFENVAFPLRVRKVGGDELRRRVEEVLELVDLADLPNRLPGQLSGGQQQRVSLARALVFHPQVVLMDEPLGSLDKRLRVQLQSSIRLLQKRIGFTTIYVTHDQEEAFALSDRIVVMHHGGVRQVGNPEAIYRAPSERFVADFVGELNEVSATVERPVGAEATLRLGADASMVLPPWCAELPDGAAVSAGVRPETVRLSPTRDGDHPLCATVELVAFHGSFYRVLLAPASGQRFRAEVRAATVPYGEGDQVWLGWSPDDMIALTGRP